MSKIEVADGTKIAIAFPGQGAHDPEKMARLIREHSVVLPLIQEAEEELKMSLLPLLLSESTAQHVALTEDELAVTSFGPTEVMLTRDNQVKLYIGEAALWLAAQNEGVVPDNAEQYFFGASAGEFAALMAAGAYDFSTGVRLINTRGEEMHSASIINPGEMLTATGIPIEEGRLLSEMFPGVHAVNSNPGNQTVFSGAAEGIRALGAYLTDSENWPNVTLDWPSIHEAAHTDHMAPAVPGLKKALRAVNMKRPRNFMGNQAVMIDKVRNTKEHLAEQLTRGVLLRESAIELRDTYEVKMFVDAGLRRVISSQMKREFRRTVQIESIIDYLLPEKA